MKMQMDIFPYITGEKFDGLIPFVIEQKESIQDRMDFVEDIVRGKKIIHVGCLDHLPMIKDKINNNRWFHGRLTETTKECLGIDINREGIEILRQEMNITNIRYANIESDDKLPEISSNLWDYIVFGEIIEHVDNPTLFLQKFICNYGENVARIIITVPNAFRAGNIKGLLNNVESINSDHRYWFSPYTIWKVVHKAGLEVERMQMCKYSSTGGFLGKLKDNFLNRFPIVAENIVVICKKKDFNAS